MLVEEVFIDELILKCSEGDDELKDWKCVKVGHHMDVAEEIKDYQKEGWRLHTYQAAGASPAHFLLFEKGE